MNRFQRSWIVNIIHLIVLILLGIYCFGFPFIPAQDLPNLTYQGYVLNQMVFHENTFSGYFGIYHYIPPNAISTIIIGLLDLFFDPVFSGKLYLFLVSILLYSGLFLYISQRKNHHFLIIGVAFYLTLNSSFLNGYLNFITGLALALHVIVYLRNHNFALGTFRFFLIFLLLYLCHFIALGILTIYLISVFVYKRNVVPLKPIIFSLVPLGMIFIHYLLSRKNLPLFAAGEGYSIIDILLSHLYVLIAPILPIHHYKWVLDLPKWLNILCYLAGLGLAITMIIQLLHKKGSTQVLIARLCAIISFSLAFLLPGNLGGVLMPGERFVVFFIASGMLVLFSNDHLGVIRSSISKAMGLIAFLSIPYLFFAEKTFNEQVRHSNIPQEAIQYPWHKYEGSNPFLHFHLYHRIYSHSSYPIFNTGILSSPDSIHIKMNN